MRPGAAAKRDAVTDAELQTPGSEQTFAKDLAEGSSMQLHANGAVHSFLDITVAAISGLNLRKALVVVRTHLKRTGETVCDGAAQTALALHGLVIHLLSLLQQRSECHRNDPNTQLVQHVSELDVLLPPDVREGEGAATKDSVPGRPLECVARLQITHDVLIL